MLLLLSHRKKRKAAAASAAQDRMAANIVHHCIRWQSKCAAWMQHKAERLSGRGKVMVLSLFCLLAGGYSSHLAVDSFFGKPVLPLTRINQPGHVQPSGDKISQAPVVITEEEYQKIQWFRQYLDSLAQTSPGEKFPDSLLAGRPGFMDSVLLLENLYQSQIKK